MNMDKSKHLYALNLVIPVKEWSLEDTIHSD